MEVGVFGSMDNSSSSPTSKVVSLTLIFTCHIRLLLSASLIHLNEMAISLDDLICVFWNLFT